MSSTAANELALARRFLALTKEYANRPVVARRNTVPTLLGFLRSADRDVRRAAADALLCLAQHPENPEFLCHERGFVHGLYEAFKESEAADDAELHAVLAGIFDCLRAVLDSENGGGVKTGDKNGAAVADGESSRIARGRTTRVLRGATACRSVKLSLPNAEPHCAADIEDIFHTTRGVVSFTLDVAVREATLYMSTPTPTLLKILADSGFDAKVLSDVEVAAQSAGDAASSGAASGGGAAPGYLSSLRSFASGLYRNGLVVHGGDSGPEGNTLAERLRRSKEEARRDRSVRDKLQIGAFMSKITAGWW